MKDLIAIYNVHDENNKEIDDENKSTNDPKTWTSVEFPISKKKN